MAQTSKNVGMSAKDYAKQQLGDLDLSYLNAEREAANKNYSTSKSSLENNFNNLMNQISSNRADTRKNFNVGRATVAEDAYLANRQNKEDIASRVIGSSGLRGLGEVGNRMETGRQYSNLANQFYNSMSDLDTTEQQGRSQYDIDQQIIKNDLDQILAGIDTREAEATRGYNQTLGQLAESIQGRWDANANAEAALAQAREAQRQAHRDAVNAARQNLTALNKQDFAQIMNSGADEDTIISNISARFGVSPQTARNVLRTYGYYGYGPFNDSNYDVNYDYVSNYIYNNGIK